VKQGPATATQPPAAGPGPQDNYTENKNINFTHWDQSETERFLKLFNGGPIKLRVRGEAITRESWYDAMQFLIALGTNEEVFLVCRAVRSREGPEALERLGKEATVVEQGPHRYFVFPPTEDLDKLAVMLQGDIVDSVPVPGFGGARVLHWLVLQRNTVKEESVVLPTQSIRESEIDRGSVLRRNTSYQFLNSEERKSVPKKRNITISLKISREEEEMLERLANIRGTTASQVLREGLATYYSIIIRATASVTVNEMSVNTGPVVLNNPVINITLPPPERDQKRDQEQASDRKAHEDRVKQLEKQVRDYEKTIEGYRKERGELTDKLKKCVEAFSKVRLKVDYAKKFIEENNLDKAKQLLDEARSLIDETRKALSAAEQA